jgi:hypothetical protein
MKRAVNGRRSPRCNHASMSRSPAANTPKEGGSRQPDGLSRQEGIKWLRAGTTSLVDVGALTMGDGPEDRSGSVKDQRVAVALALRFEGRCRHGRAENHHRQCQGHNNEARADPNR